MPIQVSWLTGTYRRNFDDFSNVIFQHFSWKLWFLAKWNLQISTVLQWIFYLRNYKLISNDYWYCLLFLGLHEWNYLTLLYFCSVSAMAHSCNFTTIVYNPKLKVKNWSISPEYTNKFFSIQETSCYGTTYFSMNACLHKPTAKFLIILLHICRSTLSNVFSVCGSYHPDFH